MGLFDRFKKNKSTSNEEQSKTTSTTEVEETQVSAPETQDILETPETNNAQLPDNPSEYCLKAFDFVQNVLNLGGFNCTTVVTETENSISISISGDDASLLIGYRGDVLDNLQYLASISVRPYAVKNKKLIIDVLEYRQKRENTLNSLALKLADKAYKTQTEQKLEPMNAFDRRVVHSALNESDIVTTKSAGKEPRRFVIIVPNPLPEPDLYNHQDRNDFKRNGAGKTRSFGQKKKMF